LFGGIDYYLVVETVSIFIFMLSGVPVAGAVVMVSVVAGAMVAVLSTVAESELLIDVEDSFVPQLMANIPTAAVNTNFFIIFCFGCLLPTIQ
jgi:hypothetical protein